MRLRRRGWRINLRPLGDLRNLAWIPIAWILLAHTLSFLLWFAGALANGAADAGAASGGAAARRPHGQQHHQHY